MMEKETITIVVPVYNVESYIHRCVDSILNQSYEHFELILVDDGSPDNCPEICDDYARHDSRIEVIHQINGGLSAARNSGIDWSFFNSSSKWITFIDSDDWINKDYLSLFLSEANKNKTDIVVGRFKTVHDDSNVKPLKTIRKSKLFSPEQYWVNNRTNATVAWGKLYKKRLFKDIRYPDGKYHEDEYVTYKLLFSQDSISVLEDSVYYYYQNGNSISQISYLKRLPDVLESINMHINFFKNSKWEAAYRLEVVKYAGAISDAIWLIKDNSDRESIEKTKVLRKALKDFLKVHKSIIKFIDHKDIYISAYPNQKFFIRLFGVLSKG